MQPVFRFAHLSDPHLPLLPGWPARLHHLAGKRLLGFISWRRKRHRVHRPEVLARLLDDIAAHRPDHLVMTGDLVNIALPDEFERARAWLERVGPPDRVTVVPGNHDATVRVPWESGLGLWRPWMTGDGASGGEPEAGPSDDGAGFPFLRLRGPVAFIGVSTAVPSPPLLATGAVGARQAALLETMLGELGGRGLFRVVLMHHPPLRVGRSERKALTDRRRIQGILARTGAELVLHGHHHRNHVASLPGPGGSTIPVMGVASASADAAAGGQPASWNRFTVAPLTDGGWRLAGAVRTCGADGFHTDGAFEIDCGRRPIPA
ncbi:metallophosphoesterase family protein [Azospirillum picis]|uniref:3',5'-cyclic AMP phosphodiesterase CpdA n=1 Tax=Azospirillum picis TaxID=488438 RepID=A0ABU0MN68_9PROT|nr:metallophosphoesterase [Azospirillum picis]MBP2301128.1 3',5'-cyclic AMP phosphodiesterase CpdA [Azospirillum picis]MDQ0534910.1 3',5'-cyclic AMP phosphodiesterase CpdA [Azospirillum picis]